MSIGQLVHCGIGQLVHRGIGQLVHRGIGCRERVESGRDKFGCGKKQRGEQQVQGSCSDSRSSGSSRRKIKGSCSSRRKKGKEIGIVERESGIGLPNILNEFKDAEEIDEDTDLRKC